MSRSFFLRAAMSVAATAGILSLAGCLGTESNYANRPIPPSTIKQRVLVAIQNPAPAVQGALQILDARYDIRNSQDGKKPSFFIANYPQGATPSQILNYPEQVGGYVYSSTANGGLISSLNYGTEGLTGSTSNLPSYSASVFITSDGKYTFAANQTSGYATVGDSVQGFQIPLNLPNVYKVAVNPTGTVALAFVQNSNYAYRFIRLQQPSGTYMTPPVFHPTNGPWPAAVSPVDCEPVNLPRYCIVPVLDQNDNPIQFNRPYNAIFSSDGTTAWLLNCGPECGNSAPDVVTGHAAASVSFLNTGVLNVYNFPGSTYPAPPASPPSVTERQRVSVAGGATMALYGNGTLYVSGQQRQSDGLFEGFLSVLNLSSNQVTATYPISDGTHTKMLFGDDNTLWIGSQLCQTGERTAQKLVDPTIANGCLTFFNLADNSVLVEPGKTVDRNGYGDLTGMCAIVEWHKMFTAEGGQIHIYATTEYNGSATGATGYNSGFRPGIVAGSELDNLNATVQGTAYDVAYMDAPSNAAN